MEINLAQGYPEDFSNLTKEQIESIIEWELSMFSDKTPTISHISDNIFIGNYPAALNKKILDENKITHVVISGKNMIDLYKHSIDYKILPLYDSPYTKLKKYFNETNEFIFNAISKNISESQNKYNVLIHCGAGVSRSVSLALSFYIGKMNMTYEEGIKHIKSKRKIANPNSGFEKELREYSYEIHKKF